MNDFFLSSQTNNLNNLSFYICCPSINSKEKGEICDMILKNNGVRKNFIK